MFLPPSHFISEPSSAMVYTWGRVQIVWHSMVWDSSIVREWVSSCVLSLASHLSEPCSEERSQQPVSRRVPSKSLPPRRTCNTPSMLPNTVRGSGGGRFPIHVMIATLPIPASVGELVGVCRRLNQSHHSRVSPPLSGGTLVKCLEIAKISLK